MTARGFPLAGRTQHYLSNWQTITQDEWVLSVVKGYRIKFLQKPYQQRKPLQLTFIEKEEECMQAEIQSMLDKLAISREEDNSESFYSQMFLVPKKDGRQRPVINLKRLNQSVKTEHFKMEGIHMLIDLLRAGDWMAKIDLKDAYFIIPIAQDWKLCPAVFHQINQRLGPSGGGSVCQQTDSPAADICQLETRPNGHGHGCVHFGLGRAQSICQSPVEPDWQSTDTDSPTARRACPGGTGVEGAGMVPSATGDAGEGSTSDPPQGEPHHRDSLPEVIPQLAVWTISGSATRTAKFQREQRNCS
jgi:hypothetical protein